jgi:hypothetical protein
MQVKIQINSFLFIFFAIVLPFCLQAQDRNSSATGVHAPIALIAGRGEAGLKDGAYYEALFSKPSGLAYTNTGNQLYVSDRENFAIRRIRLNHYNDVDTIIENSAHQINKNRYDSVEPGALAFIPPQTLAVYDYGLKRLVIFDIDAPSARSYVELPGNVVNMVTIPNRNGILYTLEGQPHIYQTTLERKEAEKLPLRHEPPISAQYLYWQEDNLLIGDTKQHIIYRARYIEDTLKVEEGTVNLPPNAISIFATTSNIFATTSDSSNPIFQLYPVQSPLDNLSLTDPKIRDIKPDVATKRFPITTKFKPFGITDPSDPNRVALSLPEANKIIEINNSNWFDIRFKKLSDNKEQLYNFDFPKKKHRDVTRILTIGDLRLNTIGSINNANGEVTENSYFELFTTILNTKLNEKAALSGNKKRYEVLNLSTKSHDKVMAWAPAMAPKISKEYDVDHIVFFIIGSHSLSPYFLYPSNKNGTLIFPNDQGDHSFSLDKVKNRHLSNLFKLLTQKKLLTITSGNMEWESSDQLLSTPELHSQIKRLFVITLKEWIKQTSNELNRSPSFTFVYIPSGTNNCCTSQAMLWAELAQQMNAQFIDLSKDIAILQELYFPIHTFDPIPLFTPTGHQLLADLLSSRLII